MWPPHPVSLPRMRFLFVGSVVHRGRTSTRRLPSDSTSRLTPLSSASCSPCRTSSGLSPPSHPATTTCTAIAPVKALRAMPGAPQKGARLNRRAPSQTALFARDARLIVLRHQCQSDPPFQRQRIQVVLGRRRMLLAVGIDADHARRHTGAYQRIPDRGSALGR